MTQPRPNDNTEGGPILDRWVPIMGVYIGRVRWEPMNTRSRSEPVMPVLDRLTPEMGAVAAD